jgi:hypothetical protein
LKNTYVFLLRNCFTPSIKDGRPVCNVGQRAKVERGEITNHTLEAGLILQPDFIEGLLCADVTIQFSEYNRDLEATFAESTDSSLGLANVHWASESRIKAWHLCLHTAFVSFVI